MNRSMMLSLWLIALAGTSVHVPTSLAQPQPITFQGELKTGNVIATGTYDMLFTLFDASSAGNQVGTSQCVNNVSVVDGRFTVALDFGTAANLGTNLFVQVQVRLDTGLACNNTSGLTTLAPRLAFTPSPRSYFAVNAQNATTAATATTATTAANANTLGGQGPGFFQNANNLTGGTVPDARLSTNIPRVNANNTFTGINNFNGFTSIGGTASLTGSDRFNVQGDSGASGYVGMYTRSTNAAGLPFYGYSAANRTMWTYWNPTSNDWRVSMEGGEPLIVNSNGRLDVTGPIVMPGVLGQKLSLWGDPAVASYGLGVQSGILQVHSDAFNTSIDFGYGRSGNMASSAQIVHGNGFYGSQPSLRIGSPSNNTPTGLALERDSNRSLLNLDMNYRGGTTASPGGAFRIDGRASNTTPLFQWLSRPANGTAERSLMDVTEAGSLRIIGNTAAGYTNTSDRLIIFGATDNGNLGDGIAVNDAGANARSFLFLGVNNNAGIQRWSRQSVAVDGKWNLDGFNASASAELPMISADPNQRTVNLASTSGTTNTNTRFQINGTTPGYDGMYIVDTEATGARPFYGWITNNASSFVELNSTLTQPTIEWALPSGGARFLGNVNVTGTLSKGAGTFKIDHPLDPENKFLYHSFVESPDMMNIYNGNATTGSDGFVTVTLPGYFEALNNEFRYQLTVIDGSENDFIMAKVAREVQDNTFVIRTSMPNIKVSWQVTGIRKDAFANTNRVRPEVEKSAQEKGKYLHPRAFGKPDSMGIDASPESIQMRNDIQKYQDSLNKPVESSVVGKQ